MKVSDVSPTVVTRANDLRPGTRLEIAQELLHAVWEVDEAGDLRFLHFSCMAFDPGNIQPDKEKWFRALEVQATGYNQNDHHGLKHTGTAPARAMRFARASEEDRPEGRRLTMHLTHDNGLEARIHWQFYHGVQAARTWTEIINAGDKPLDLEHVASFNLVGVEKEALGDWDGAMRVHLGHNAWKNEAQWRAYRPSDLGLYADDLSGFSMKRIAVSGLGGWSNGEYLSMAALENTTTGTTLAWDIEHFGSWGYEISSIGRHLYAQAYGPSYNDHHWLRTLAPGETFTSVPVALTVTVGGLEAVAGHLNDLRRARRRPNRDNEELPVIFNDYMNCLMGDPTTEKLLPLIDTAAAIGCEYFVIDAGWYDDGPWWDGVGQWLPSRARFPNGLEEPLGHIRARGMVPGLWLEIESMGINCPLAATWPDACFFQRRGKRVVSHSRYHLDFRHPLVRQHADKVVDRVVGTYGAGYIKMDFNINLGPGTDTDADSPGDGFLRHNDAYLDWLDGVWARYPDLVIENCGSGGLRMNSALLRSHSIQSTSDCQDYRKYAPIAAACPTVAPPEQLAVWSYPATDASLEETAFNMLNTLLLRIHMSGHVQALPPDRLALVKEGIGLYKTIRPHIKTARPFWPLGIPRIGDDWVALGLDSPEAAYLAVWRIDAEEQQVRISLPPTIPVSNPRLLYPSAMPGTLSLDTGNAWLSVTIPSPVAGRLIALN